MAVCLVFTTRIKPKTNTTMCTIFKITIIWTTTDLIRNLMGITRDLPCPGVLVASEEDLVVMAAGLDTLDMDTTITTTTTMNIVTSMRMDTTIAIRSDPD